MTRGGGTGMVTVGNRYREVKADRFTYFKLDRYVRVRERETLELRYAQLHVRWELCIPIEQLIGASCGRECRRGLNSWCCVEPADIALC